MENIKKEEMIDFSMGEDTLNDVVYVRDENGNIIEVLKKDKATKVIKEGQETHIQFLKD